MVMRAGAVADEISGFDADNAAARLLLGMTKLLVGSVTHGLTQRR